MFRRFRHPFLLLALLVVAPLASARPARADQPFLGEIRMFAGNFAPLGWQFCEGQVLSIAQYDTLFQVLGTTYGGDGETHLPPSRPARPRAGPCSGRPRVCRRACSASAAARRPRQRSI